MNPKLLLLLISVLFCTGAQAQSTKETFDYGRMEGATYINEYLNLQIDLPEDWYQLSDKELDQLFQKGKELMTRDRKEMERMMDIAELNSATLAGRFEHPLGSLVAYNASIVLLAENIHQLAGYLTAADYQRKALESIKGSGMDFEVLEASGKKRINGIELYAMRTSLTMRMIEMPIYQQYHTLIVNNFCITIIASYTDERQRNQLDQSVQSLRFRK